jgi:probable F420-dependent oxidoreductase
VVLEVQLPSGHRRRTASRTSPDLGSFEATGKDARMADTRPFRFGVTAHQAASGAEWRAFSRKVEDLGFATLFVPDHLGDQLAPVPALAAAADVTRELRVGMLVACSDFRHPVMHAKELATLDLLSGGRAEWGIGAGWLAPEYKAAGLRFDRGGVRVDRMQEAIAVMKGLLGDGAVTHDGRYYTVTDLDGRPKPVQRPHPPLLVGGARKRMLRFAAREADIVGVAPSPRIGAPGAGIGRDTPESSVDRQLEWLRDAAGDRFDELEINMVAYPVVVTDDREQQVAKVADRMKLEPSAVLTAPHVWIGTPAQISDTLEERRQRWGVSYWVVPAAALDAVAPVAARLVGG